MSQRVSIANLSQAAQDLMVEWDQTKAWWRDLKSIQFENDYLAVLPDHLSRASNVIGELDALIRKVRSDCE